MGGSADRRRGVRRNALPPVAPAACAAGRARRRARLAGIYSLVALATLIWLARAYRAAPAGDPLWPVGDAIWSIATIVMLVASVLFMGSLVRNPALPDPGSTPKPVPEAHGVYAITRHPIMWAFALWGGAHILVYPDPSNVILAGAIIVLALAGAYMQDRKKAQLQPDFWPEWERRTSYLPFAGISRGRARIGTLWGPRARRWRGAVVGSDLGAHSACGLGGGRVALDRLTCAQQMLRRRLATPNETGQGSVEPAFRSAP